MKLIRHLCFFAGLALFWLGSTAFSPIPPWACIVLAVWVMAAGAVLTEGR